MGLETRTCSVEDNVTNKECKTHLTALCYPLDSLLKIMKWSFCCPVRPSPVQLRQGSFVWLVWSTWTPLRPPHTLYRKVGFFHFEVVCVCLASIGEFPSRCYCQSCVAHVCRPKRNCAAADWSPWKSCSTPQPCSGVQTRTHCGYCYSP